MRSRLIILIVAVGLGLIAALGAARYLDAERQRLLRDNEMVDVLVAMQDLPGGMTSEEILKKKYVETREIPRQFVAEGAISSAAALEGKVVASAVSKDEQITRARFKFPAEVGLSSSTPQGYLALSIPYEAARGVGGLLKPGDQVAVFATLDPDEKTSQTQIIIPKAKVLAVGQALQAEEVAVESAPSGGLMSSSGGSSGPGTITLALAPTDAEKVVFAQEKGKVWLGLFAPTDTTSPVTSGVSYRQVLD